MTEKIANEIIKYVQQAEGFVVEQAPLLAQEIILRGRVWWTFVLAAACLITEARKVPRRSKLEAAEQDILVGGLYVLTAVCGIGVIAVMPVFLTVWLAPRLYVLKVAQDLIGG